LNCCVAVRIAWRYASRNWVKQLTIGIQVTSQAYANAAVAPSTRKIIAFDGRFPGAPSIIDTFRVPPRKIINPINHETSSRDFIQLARSALTRAKELIPAQSIARTIDFEMLIFQNN